MSWPVAVWALCGAGAGLGLWMLFAAPSNSFKAGEGRRSGAQRLMAVLAGGGRQRALTRMVMAATAGAGAGAVTGWPAAALLVALAAWALPSMLGPDRDHTRQVARIEAIATWTEMLRDTLSAAAGLEQAIAATAPVAPEPIRAQVDELTARLRHGERLPAALRAFAAEMADPTADLVVAALVLAAERQASHLAPLLGSLAAAAREQAGMRLRVAASRARVRTSVRVITAVTVTMATGLVVLNRGYLAPYDTVTGQLVLLAVGCVFTGSLFWLHRISRLPAPERLGLRPGMEAL